MAHGNGAVGLVLGSALPPERLGELARVGEELGFGELWFAEDYFFTGGISAAAAALAATREIPVGLGIVSALVRHPALLAMELATLARLYPGRLRPGIGLGVPSWMRQMGLVPRSSLGAMRECVTAVRRLLDGETVDEAGDHFVFDGVALTHPPAERVPLAMGVLGPKMLALSGEIADGTVGSMLASPAYVRWAREQIAAGAARAGRDARAHRFTVFAIYSVDRDSAAAKEALRALIGFYLAAVPKSALTDVYGIADELAALASGGPEAIARGMPAQWLEDLVVAGEPDECVAKIHRLFEAGADSVVLFPSPPERAFELLELTAAEVLPELR